MHEQVHVHFKGPEFYAEFGAHLENEESAAKGTVSWDCKHFKTRKLNSCNHFVFGFVTFGFWSGFNKLRQY